MLTCFIKVTGERYGSMCEKGALARVWSTQLVEWSRATPCSTSTRSTALLLLLQLLLPRLDSLLQRSLCLFHDVLHTLQCLPAHPLRRLARLLGAHLRLPQQCPWPDKRPGLSEG